MLMRDCVDLADKYSQDGRQQTIEKFATMDWDEVSKSQCQEIYKLMELANSCCLEAPSKIPDLAAQPCPAPAPRWHATSLRRILESDSPEPASRVRAAYHARWLAWLLKPQDTDLLPLVSIVIPTFNSGERLLHSVGSAIHQSYPRCEVIVVDDGSIERPERWIKPYADRVRLVKQSNQGVAQARNRGIDEAAGEFIHFLDADDILDPDSVQRKFDAFHTVADAELCFSLYRCVGNNGVKGADNHRAPAVGDKHCPSQGLLRTMMRRFPFQISSVMVPRWLMLETGPFDTDLKQSQDNRYWFCLGLRNTKVIGLQSELNTRYFSPASLTSREDESSHYSVISYLRNLNQLLACPRHWRYVGPYIRRCWLRRRWSILNAPQHFDVAAVCEVLFDTLESIQEFGDAARLSALPILRTIADQTDKAAKKHRNTADSEFHRRMTKVLQRAMQTAAPLSQRDFEFWLEEQDGRLRFAENGTSIQLLVNWLDERLRTGTLPDGFSGIHDRALAAFCSTCNSHLRPCFSFEIEAAEVQAETCPSKIAGISATGSTSAKHREVQTDRPAQAAFESALK